MTRTDQQNVPKLRFPGVAEEWKKYRLGELGSFKSGVGFPESEQGGDAGTPFYKVSDMNLPGNESEMTTANNYVTDEQVDRLKLKPIKTRAVIFAKVGAAIFLERKRQAKDFLLDNNMMAFIPGEHVGKEYLNHLFSVLRLSKFAQVGALPSYNGSDLATIKLNLPTLPEQRKIAGFLGAVDTKIAQLVEKKRLLEDYKKGCMQQLFSQKIRFKDDTSNDFPDWKEKRLGDVLTVEMGQSPSSDSYNDVGEGLPLVQGNADIVNRLTVPRRFTSAPTKTCQRGDILISVRAPIGEVSKATLSACLGRGMGSIRPTDGVTEYWYQFLLHLEPMWHRVGQGSTFTAINGADIRKLPAVVPSPTEQRKIADFLSALDHKIDLVGQELDHARTFKQGLLQQMFV
jgi:type I restriction enzyme, S subunit